MMHLIGQLRLLRYIRNPTNQDVVVSRATNNLWLRHFYVSHAVHTDHEESYTDWGVWEVGWGAESTVHHCHCGHMCAHIYPVLYASLRIPFHSWNVKMKVAL